LIVFFFAVGAMFSMSRVGCANLDLRTRTALFSVFMHFGAQIPVGFSHPTLIWFDAPLARYFHCAFRRADGQGYLLLQIPLHPKAAPGIRFGYARALAADNRQGGGL
jgi:hypothetical protein